MKYLVLDTATDHGFVALFEGEKLLASKKTPAEKKNSSALMQQLDEIWNETGLHPEELTFIGVGVGPGSYTGVRVGVVIAKMLHLAWKTPLVAVPSLTAFAPKEQGRFVAAFDGRISGAYLIEGEFDGEVVSWVGAPYICPVEQLPSVPLVSPHPRFQTELALPNIAHFAREARSLYDPSSPQKGEVEVLYLRKTQAEQNL